MAKTIITAALTGAVTPAGYHIPETPEQIVQAAYECWQLGAAVVHIHTRAADGKGAMNTQAFREIVEGIRAHKDCDVQLHLLRGLPGASCHRRGALSAPHDRSRH